MRRALSLLIAFSWLLNGCHSWHTEEVAPATYIDSQHPAKDPPDPAGFEQADAQIPRRGGR